MVDRIVVLVARMVMALGCALLWVPARVFSSPNPEATVAAVFKAYDHAATPGCAAGIFDHGQPRLIRGFGAADVQSGARIDGDTAFYAASVAKQFTALAIVKLAEQGKLTLQDEVRRWIPELPRAQPVITIDMLMHHTSGLRDVLALFYLAGVTDFSRVVQPQAIEMLARQRDTNFVPGTRFSYSNSGYTLLAEIVSRVSGEPFDVHMRRTVFEPLGMSNTSMRPRPRPARAKWANGYVKTDTGFEARDTYPSIAGAGGLMTTVSDLGKFDHDFHVTRRVWTQYTRRLMLTPGTLTSGERVTMPGEGLFYAGGLMVGERAGQEWITHDGASPSGFRSVYVRLPKLRFSVAVLCNRVDANAVDHALTLIRALHGDEFNGANIGAAGAPWERPPATQPLTAELMRALPGFYQSDEIGARYELRATAGQMTVHVAPLYDAVPRDNVLGPLTMLTDDVLYAGSMKLTLDRAADGSIEGFVLGWDRVYRLQFVRVSEQ